MTMVPPTNTSNVSPSSPPKIRTRFLVWVGIPAGILVAVLIFLNTPTGRRMFFEDAKQEKSVTYWMEQLKNEKNRVMACTELGRRGEKALEAVPALLSLVKEKDQVLRASAVHALAEIGLEGHAEAIDPLLEALGDRGPWIRYDAARALGTLGPLGKKAIPKLIDNLKHRRRFVRETAAESLALMEETAVADLKAKINDEDRRLRREVVYTLGLIGPKAKDTVPDLLKLLKNDTDTIIKANAATALGNIDPTIKEIQDALLEAAGDSDTLVRRAAAEALPSMDANPEASLKKLVQMLKEDKAAPVRESVVESLGRIHPLSDEAIQALTQAKDGDTDTDVKEAAAEVLEDHNKKKKAEG